ncbi:MAG: site-specific integrase [Thermodesulfobacteriota bacterium]|nr:site-specific integrase [Thermodesulfobacteriota bacterium]
MSKRKKTTYPGIFYRESKRIGGKGLEKIYYIIFKKDGKVYEEKAGRQYADDMTAARAAYIRAKRIEGKRKSRKEIREAAQAKKQAEADKWTVQKLFDAYIKGRAPGKSLTTDKGRYAKYLKKPFGDIEPKNILALDVDRLRIKLLKAKSPQTVLHILNLLTWIVNFGKKNGLCPGLPFHIKKPTVRNLVTEYLTSEQIKNLLTAIDNDIHPQAGAMMKLALFSGMRRGEMLKLKWEHIDFDRGFINIVDPKGGPDQVIPLNDSARELLENHSRTQTAFVFPGRGGKQLVNISKPINKIKKKAGLPAKFRPLHGLRHVFASILASSGDVDMYILQKLLTHKDGRMTQRYAHLRDEVLKKASNVAGDIINHAVQQNDQEANLRQKKAG